MVRTINNFPVTIGDFRNANTMCGCNVPTLKGKTVHQQTKRVQAEYIEAPDSFWERIGNLPVAADIMFVNGI